MSTTTASGYSFLDAETMGGDELRSCSAEELVAMLARGFELIAAEQATWPERKGRELRVSKGQVRRAVITADRIRYYIGVKLTEASWWLPGAE